jgi:hypothetical protein
MFGRWLGLLRRGPDLLRAASLDADPNAAKPGKCDAPLEQCSALSSTDADTRMRRREPDERPAPLT